MLPLSQMSLGLELLLGPILAMLLATTPMTLQERQSLVQGSTSPATILSASSISDSPRQTISTGLWQLFDGSAQTTTEMVLVRTSTSSCQRTGRSVEMTKLYWGLAGRLALVDGQWTSEERQIPGVSLSLVQTRSDSQLPERCKGLTIQPTSQRSERQRTTLQQAG